MYFDELYEIAKNTLNPRQISANSYAGSVAAAILTESIPFSDITYDICKREGQDATLESWVEGHAHFFKEDGKQLGYKFSYDVHMVFEDFKVVYQV